jgi:hypothetical protein
MSSFLGFASDTNIYVKGKTTSAKKRKYKTYYELDVTSNPGSTFYLPEKSDMSQFCIVSFNDTMNWIQKNTDSFFESNRETLDTNPEFKYYMNCDHEDNSNKSHEQTHTNMVWKYSKHVTKLNGLSNTTDETNVYKNYENSFSYKYRKYAYQFDCIADLKELIELGKMNFASRLHQIRFDIVTDNRVPFTTNYKISRGTPFSPDQLDSTVAYFNPEGRKVKVSYLIEKYGQDMKSHIQQFNNEDRKIRQIGERYNAFVDAFVETGRIYVTLDFENLCVKYINNAYKSIGFLDIDCRYLIKDTSADFKKHGKVYMKFLFFAMCGIMFPTWYVTKPEVVDMIQFFYQFKFMIYENNPITSLIVHLQKNKKYEGTCDKFQQLFEGKVDDYFNKFIQNIPVFTEAANAGGIDAVNARVNDAANARVNDAANARVNDAANAGGIDAVNESIIGAEIESSINVSDTDKYATKKNGVLIPHLLENFGGKKSSRMHKSKKRNRKGKKSRRKHTSKRHHK